MTQPAGPPAPPHTPTPAEKASADRAAARDAQVAQDKADQAQADADAVTERARSTQRARRSVFEAVGIAHENQVGSLNALIDHAGRGEIITVAQLEALKAAAEGMVQTLRGLASGTIDPTAPDAGD